MALSCGLGIVDCGLCVDVDSTAISQSLPSQLIEIAQPLCRNTVAMLGNAWTLPRPHCYACMMARYLGIPGRGGAPREYPRYG